MTVEYYHLSPVILTDDLFLSLTPPLTTSGSAAQRRAAYLIAEQHMIKALSTFLLPTRVTGSFSWPLPGNFPVALPYKRIVSIDQVVVQSRDECNTCDLTNYDACALIRDQIGYIDPVITEGSFLKSCGGHFLHPYKLLVTYTSGLPTGTAALDSSLHRALTMVARSELLGMVDPGGLEGGEGDPGVQSYGSLGYSEQRVKLWKTPFGTSAMANKAYQLIEHLLLRRALRM